MADRFSKTVRSRIMSSIRGKDTKPEVLLRKALFRRGYRYSLGYRFKGLNFTPDMVLVSRKVCVFVDGCFWHACPKCSRPPKSNRMYWAPKLERNRERDRQQDAYLKENGWEVIRVWEHEINRNLERAVGRVIEAVRSGTSP